MKNILAYCAPRLAGLILLLGLVTTAHAAGPGGFGPQPAGPTGVPIDGGASILLAGGVAFALKKLRRRPQ